MEGTRSTEFNEGNVLENDLLGNLEDDGRNILTSILRIWVLRIGGGMKYLRIPPPSISGGLKLRVLLPKLVKFFLCFTSFIT
jgi:hypothetical protein